MRLVVTDADIQSLRAAYKSLEDDGSIPVDLFTDDFVLEQSPGILDTRGTFRGRGAMASALAELRSGFDQVRFEPQAFEVHGDWLSVAVMFRANARGVQQEAAVVHLWRFRDGLIDRMRVVGQPSEVPRVLEQLQAGD